MTEDQRCRLSPLLVLLFRFVFERMSQVFGLKLTLQPRMTEAPNLQPSRLCVLDYRCGPPYLIFSSAEVGLREGFLCVGITPLAELRSPHPEARNLFFFF